MAGRWGGEAFVESIEIECECGETVEMENGSSTTCTCGARYVATVTRL